MTKLIVEMEMPKRCIKCGVRLKCKRYVCGLQQDIAEDLKPLIGDKDCLIKGELPDEHGDLVDRDEVKNEIMKRMPQWCSTADTDGFQFCSRSEMLYPISHAKVIVAAERKDELMNKGD